MTEHWLRAPGVRWIATTAVTMIGLLPEACSDSASGSGGETADEHRERPTNAAARVDELRTAFRASVERGSVALLGNGLVSEIGPASGGRVRAIVPASTAIARGALRAIVEVPERASGSALISDPKSGVALGFALEGGADAAVELANGVLLYRSGGPDGADLVHRVGALGTEDFLAFGQRPSRELVRYRLDVSKAAGLRLVGGVLELVDRGGVPRLRMREPSIVGADGRGQRAGVSIEGCAVDQSVAPPWGRAVTPPGAENCLLTISWAGHGVVYPALLDPTWTTTANTMTTTRVGHTASRLADGTVLIAGGQHPNGASTDYVSTAELFDPSSNTFAATASMSVARSFHGAAVLSDGRVLVAGGATTGGSITSTAEIFNPGATPSFTATGNNMVLGRKQYTLTKLASGNVLAAGGETASYATSTAEIFTTSSGTFATTGAMSVPRTTHYATLLSSNKVLVACGYTDVWPYATAKTELYEPLTGTWSPTGDNPYDVHEHDGALLPNGKVLVAGGYAEGWSQTVSYTTLFDLGTWTQTGSLSTARQRHTVTLLSGGAGALAVGGVIWSGSGTPSTYHKSAELYDVANGTWTTMPSMSEARFWHTATLLNDGRVLVTGGDGPLGPLGTAELFGLDVTGTTCTSNTSCRSGYCFDGVCCDTDCSGACLACAQAKTGQPNGTCAPVTADTDPNNDCLDDGSPNCTRNGLCDGAGGCKNYPSASCTPRPCTAGTECTSGYCVDGICCSSYCSSTCYACTAAKKGGGLDGICDYVAAGTDPDGECVNFGSGICLSDGTCNSGACQSSKQGTPCSTLGCAGATTLTQDATCNSYGECPASSIVDCSPYVCDSTAKACKTSCSSSSDCAPTLNCVGGRCQLNPQGQPCTSGAQCQTGYCADGVCCNNDCSGQCEACNLSGSIGACTPVVGAPRGTRSPCYGTAGNPCAGFCDGTASSACYYPGSTTACGTSTSCSNGQETAHHCNGSGDCATTMSTRSCLPYVCGTDRCLDSCTSDADCVTDQATCFQSKCVSTSVAFCSDDHTLRGPGTKVTSCGAYKCDKDQCLTRCYSNTDCVKGATCYQQTHVCSAPQASSQDSGCGCELPGKTRSNGREILAVIVLGMILMRRRRPLRNGC